VKRTPSQVIAVILVIAGLGFTVITTVKLLLLVHPFNNVGVTVNVTDCAMLEVLEKVPAITELPAAKEVQVTLAEEGVALNKVYVVPSGTIPCVILTGLKLIEPSLHTT
jgi:hypothetical protein